MTHQVHFPILTKLGLSEGEVLIYELLVESGRSKARDLVDPSGLGRGNVYNILTQLQAKGLILAVEGKQTVYEAVDPSLLRKLIDQKTQEVKRLEADFNESLSQLTSTFNLTTGRPAIQVFEGLEGAEKAIFDSVNAKTEVLTYYDFSALKDRMVEIDDRYYKSYAAKGTQKRILVTDSEAAHAYFSEPLKNTKVGFVKNFPFAFSAGIQIYDGKVAFVSLKNDRFISIIMADQVFYEMMRQFFEFHWNLSDQAALAKPSI